MKKIVIMILILLPFVISIMVSLTGRVVSLTSYIPVDTISFVDEYEVDVEKTIVIRIGQEYSPNVKVNPNLATNKKYNLKLDEKYSSIIELKDNIIKGLSFGFAEVIVISDFDKNIYDKLVVKVSDEDVQNIYLSENSKKLNVGESYMIDAYVLPTTASNKLLHFTSSNVEAVTVSASGEVKVKSYVNEPVVITITADGDKTVTKTLTITITEEEYSLIFIPVKENKGLYQLTLEDFVSDKFDLMSILYFDETIINEEKIEFVVTSNKKKAGAETNGTRYLTVANKGVMFEVTASCGSYTAKIMMMLT